MNICRNNYCIVGFGNHAKTRLLPTLEKLNKKIFGIVSSKQDLNLQTKVFKNLQDALNKSNSNTNFIISTPPKEHFAQMKQILDAGRNIYVEKPIFSNFDEAKYISNFLNRKKLFVVELLMYKYTKQYKKFLQIWGKKKNQCIQIECFFNIPDIPSNTFRDNKDIISSPLYDIGCYIFSLLVDLEISLKNIEISNIIIKDKKIIQFYICGFFKKLKIYIEFGIGKKYKNLVRLNFLKDYNIEFNKFFYGREAEKRIFFKNKNILKNFVFDDISGFENIFQHPDSFWLDNQRKRFENIIKVNKKLCSLTNGLIVSNSYKKGKM